MNCRISEKNVQRSITYSCERRGDVRQERHNSPRQEGLEEEEEGGWMKGTGSGHRYTLSDAGTFQPWKCMLCTGADVDIRFAASPYLGSK